MILSWRETDKRTGYIYVRWLDGKTKRGKSFKFDLQDAKRFQIEKDRELSNRTIKFVDLSRSAADGVASYYEDARLSKKSESTLSKIRVHVQEFIADKKTMADVTPESLKAWRLALLKFVYTSPKGQKQGTYTAQTVSTKLSAVRTWIKWCVKNKWLAENVFTLAEIEMPDIVHALNDWKDHEIPLLEEAGARWGILPHIRFAYMTGCRQAELLTARWPSSSNTIVFDGFQTKNKKERAVMLRPEVLAVLGPRRPGALIFENWTKQKLRYRWRKVLKETGLAKTGRVWHSFRKTFCRLWIEGGGTVVDLMDATGHKDERSARPYRVFSKAHMDKRWSAIDFPGISRENPGKNLENVGNILPNVSDNGGAITSAFTRKTRTDLEAKTISDGKN